MPAPGNSTALRDPTTSPGVIAPDVIAPGVIAPDVIAPGVAAPGGIAPAVPGPRPTRRHGLLRCAIDALTNVVNRALDRTPGVRAWYRRALARTEYREVAIPLHRGGAGLDGLRIAFLTDLHAGSFVGSAELRAVFERVAAQAPDLVCLGGDLVNSRPDEIDLLRAPLEVLAPRLGTYAVLGNHDRRWGGDPQRVHAVLSEHGVTVLDNRGVRIRRDGASLWLCGVDDLSEGWPDLDAALDGRADDEPVVLLAHQPDHFLESAARGVDLTLSGHTHGGQVRLLGWAPLTHSRAGFRAGEYTCGSSRLFVSRGVGATALPLRIGADPEVPVLRLVAARADARRPRG